MANVEESPLYREISLIMASNNATDIKNYIAFIHLMESNKAYKALKVMSLDITREYDKNFADVVYIQLAIPVGTYADYVYPAKDDLEITLLKQPMYPTNNETGTSIRYKAILEDTGKPRLDSGKVAGLTTEILDIANFVTVNFQLIPLSDYILRTVQVGCITRKTDVKNVLLTVITDQINKIKVDNKSAIFGVDLVDPDNKEVKEQIVIPVGTKLINVPHHIQDKECGVYNSGLSSYIQENIWYIYPKFNMYRNVTGAKSVDFIIIPKNKYPGIPTTYRRKGDQVVILITGEAKAFDNRKINQMNLANGIRFTNSETIFDNDTIKRQDNKVIVDRSSMNTEIIASAQSDDINNAPLSNNRITSNPFSEYSALASVQTNIIAFIWENSNPDIIKPGMMCNLFALDQDNKIINGSGVIKSVIHNTKLAYPGIVESKYTTNSIIEIFYDNENFNA
jgi:hypothetical protein